MLPSSAFVYFIVCRRDFYRTQHLAPALRLCGCRAATDRARSSNIRSPSAVQTTAREEKENPKPNGKYQQKYAKRVLCMNGRGGSAGGVREKSNIWHGAACRNPRPEAMGAGISGGARRERAFKPRKHPRNTSHFPEGNSFPKSEQASVRNAKKKTHNKYCQEKDGQITTVNSSAAAKPAGRGLDQHPQLSVPASCATLRAAHVPAEHRDHGSNSILLHQHVHFFFLFCSKRPLDFPGDFFRKNGCIN